MFGRKKTPVAVVPLTLDDELTPTQLSDLVMDIGRTGDWPLVERAIKDGRTPVHTRIDVLLEALVRPQHTERAVRALEGDASLQHALSGWINTQCQTHARRCQIHALSLMLMSLAGARTGTALQILILQGLEKLRNIMMGVGESTAFRDCSYEMMYAGPDKPCRKPGGQTCIGDISSATLLRWRSGIQTALAQNPHTAGEILDVVMSDCDSSVRFILAARPELSAETLSELDPTGRAMMIAARAVRERGSRRVAGVASEFSYAHSTLSALNGRLAAAQRISMLLSAHMTQPLPPSVLDALEKATDETVRLVTLYDELISGPVSESTHKVLSVVAVQADGSLTEYEAFTAQLTELSVTDMEEARLEKFEELCAQVLGWAAVSGRGPGPVADRVEVPTIQGAAATVIRNAEVPAAEPEVAPQLS